MWHRFRLVAPVCGCHLSVAVPVCGRDAGNGTAREKGGEVCSALGMRAARMRAGLGRAARGMRGGCSAALAYTADVRVHRSGGVSACFGCTAVAERLQSAGTSGKKREWDARGAARSGEMPKCRNAASKRSGRARGTARAPARAAQARAAQHPRAGICGRAASTCRHPSGETAAPRHAKASTSAP